ncbi:MAG: 3-oxoacyl-ACP reductase FabG [Chloroflexi bacterium]|nr:3-oxoacyl-ACP reductase FabG [Chloroflexota bacterium]
MTLEGKTALVTGSGRNIGRATVLELASRGANVVVNTRTNQQEADAVAKEAEAFGVKALPLLADVGNEEQAIAMVEKAAAEFGRIDILVNNAGLRLASPFTEMTTEEWRTVLAVNLDGPFFLCRAVVPAMIEAGWGRIINVSGLQAYKGGKDRAHISASKMGALGLTRALAFELAEHSILVNHIVPGAFDTTPAHAQSAQSAIPREQRAAGIPLGRLGMPEEIAKTCAFLASDDASFITGQTIHVNGGALPG